MAGGCGSYGIVDSAALMARPKPEREADPERDELHDRLHAMEARMKRLRDQRSNHNENARSHATQRDVIQGQYGELRENIKEKLAAQKEIRNEAKKHQARRDAIQEQLRALYSRSKKGRDNKNKSLILQLSEKMAEIDNIERRIETDGTLTLAKENRLLKHLKNIKIEAKALEPLVEKEMRIKIDLDDLEGSIEGLRAEADAEHKAMIALHEKADELWKEIEPLFSKRDFLKAEGDRLHNLFKGSRAEADKVHETISEMMAEVTEAREALQALFDERKSWIEEHNKAIDDSLSTPDQDKELADSLVADLLSSGGLSLGGIAGAAETTTDEAPSSGKRVAGKGRKGGSASRSKGAARGNRGRTKK
jgi:uncharacterized coiled-coil DUF342 family protein